MPVVRRRKLRVTLWILAALAVTSLVLVAVSWRDLLVRHHLGALRRDPTGFVSFLDAPEDTVKALALKAFVREPAGQQVVVSRFLDDFEQAHTQGGGKSSRRGGVIRLEDFFGSTRTH